MENKYVKTNFGLGANLTLVIKRNGFEIELTREEIYEIANILALHEHAALIVDNLDAMISFDDDDDKYRNYFTESDLRDSELLYTFAEKVSDIIPEHDPYWDAYYDVAYNVIDEYMDKHPKN